MSDKEITDLKLGRKVEMKKTLVWIRTPLGATLVEQMVEMEDSDGSN